ncbi:MAG TPA: ATP-binding protein [Terriglobales bacterium]|nr:ATP-binding protein [Terriglobales bacterium]
MNYKKLTPEPAKITLPLFFRLLIYVFILLIVILYFKVSTQLFLPFIFYSLATFALLTLLLLKERFDSELLFKGIVVVQLIFEVLVETGIMAASGRAESPFAILFLLTIVSASLFYNLAGALLVATLSSLGYASTIIWGDLFAFKNLLSVDWIKNIYQLNDPDFYRIFLYLCSFYLIAFLSGYLSERLKIKGQELSLVSLELDRMKMETDDILQHMHSGLITVDTLGRIIYYNKTAEEILGYSARELKGKSFKEVFNRRMPELGEKLEQALRMEQIDFRSELNIRNLVGQQLPLGISTSILQGKSGKKRGVIAVFQDLTEAKKIEEKMRIQDRLATVGELSARIAHEIRNPLASISGSVEILKNELNLEGENDKLLELIIKESNRLNTILTEFLQYAKLGETPLGKVELGRILDEVIEIARKHPSHQSRINIRKRLGDLPIYILAEENQLKQLLLNLLVNAQEAMEEKGTELIISCMPADLEIVRNYNKEKLNQDLFLPLSVIDQGNGIPEEQMGKIFLPFYSTKKTGTGLGLAIVQRIVTNLNGRIECKSRLGQGTAFIVYLPRYHGVKKEVAQVS